MQRPVNEYQLEETEFVPFDYENIEEGFRITAPVAADKSKYVTPVGSNVATIATGFLGADPVKDDNRGNPRIMVGKERNLTKLLNANKSGPLITMMELGVGYSDGSENIVFVFEDAIIEYRANLGYVKENVSRINIPPPCYGKTYLSLGVPEDRYDFIHSELTDHFNIPMTNVPESVHKRHDGYVWFVVNVPKTNVPLAHLKLDGQRLKARPVYDVLQSTRSSLIGNVAVTLNLKRDSKSVETAYVLAGAIHFMEVLNVTKLSSPPLNTPVIFRDSGKDMGAELKALLNLSLDKPTKA